MWRCCNAIEKLEMKKSLIITTLFFFTRLLSADAAVPLSSGADSDATVDVEQQQLQWCFVYSNRLGYEINHIDEPRLFETVSRWIGTPYKYGGDSRHGIDCSGFAGLVYRTVYDRHLEGGSAQIYPKTTPVDRKDLHEGDLVFFKIYSSRISHVGVYLGQNKFAHASVQLGVIVSDLDEPYYDKRFFKGGRFTSSK